MNTTIIAEIGINHNGDLDIAKKLIDVAKKLAIKYPDVQTLDDIYRYLFVYIADAKHRGIQHYYQDRNALYRYYELDPPPENWVQFCCDKHVLF